MSRTSSVSSTSSSRSATPSAAPSSSSGVDRQPATSPQQPASPNRSSTATSPKPYMIPAGSKAAATAPVVTAESARAQAAKPAAAVAAASPSTPTKADALSPQPPPKITLTAPSPSVPPKTTRGGRQPVNPLPHDYHLHGMVRAIRIPVTVWIIGYSTLSMLPRAVPGGEAKLHATHVPGHVTMALTRGDLAYEPLFLLSGLSVGLSLEESTVEGQGMPGTWELVRIWGRKLGEVVPVVLTTLGAVGLEMLLNDGQVGVRGRERWGHLVAVILDCQFYLVAPWVFKYLRLADRGASPRLVLSGSLLSGLLALLTTQHLGLTLPQGLPHLDRNIATGLQVPFRFPSFLAGLALSVERHRPAAPGAVKKGPSALNQGLGFAAGLAIWSWLIWGPPVGEGAGFVEAAWRAFRIPLASVAGYFCLRPLMAVPADVALETPWRRRVHDVITHPVVEAVGLVTFAAEMVHREVVLGVFTAVRTSGWLLDDQGRVSDGRVLMAWGGVAVCSGLIGFGVYKVLQAPFMGFFRRRFEKKAGKGPKAF
ncbi:hypothetical protein HK101_011260 [Irineochytrium annulatum]|nr:hypothetical protein HK101_011260 [Irineochytrium annulatum]